MARQTTSALATLVFITALVHASVTTREQPQKVAEELGLSGYVLAPDGTPVSGGSVVMQALGARATTSIDRTGRFRLVPDASGLQQLLVNVSGLAPHRVIVTVPPSRTLKLPIIRLSPATYFRVRFVSAAGEPVIAPRLRHLSLDANGIPVVSPPDDRIAEEIDGEGTITIGPLPRGITTLAFDTPPLAQTRLPDLLVTGAETLLDGGTVSVQPGIVLHVDVVDGSGAPIAEHEVALEDALPMSPLAYRLARTNQLGRATFDRLGEGRYRVRTRAVGRCGNQPLSITRLVSVSGSGTLQTRLVVGGNATFRLTSSLGPLRAVLVSALPDSSPLPPPGLRESFNPTLTVRRSSSPFTFGSSCAGTTDADGRVTLSSFPPGAARIDVRLLNSTYVRRVSVPAEAQEVAIAIPDGFLPVRVKTNAVRSGSVEGAAITWTAGGARVEATSSPNGEALLEGVGATAGTLTITAGGYQRAEVKLSEPPATLYEVSLVPAPVTRLQPRVVTTSGEPLASAVVELSVENPIEVGRVAVTDANGLVTFSDAPSGPFRLMASAGGFVPARTRMSEDSRTGIVLTLSRGYRVNASVELPAEAGPHLVRVVNEAGESMDAVLDIASDRSVNASGRISLGPLPPGIYVVELRGSHEYQPQRIHISDRDVAATFR